MDLKDKTVVIVGGTDGLGLALAKQFSEKGSKVIIIGRNPERLQQAVKELNNQVEGYQVDVTQYEDLEKVAAKTNASVLINCAAIWLEGSIMDNTPVEITTAIDINFKGVVYATKAFLPQLLKQDDACIINISSTSGLRGRDNQAVYAATKFAVTGFTECLKVDLEKTNVKVCGFYPGGMHTNLFNKAGKPKDNSDWMNPDKAAEIIVFMVERDATMMMDHVILNKRKTQTSN